ncbi:hypothetical protein AVEN_6202-1 [Araneus ventricosus]|uniref:Uncharacterized protein n=1 Tax=Araneus ventricosus TaxID=182803 RepID=A0A4Y2J2V2_ARAVE|nr:hypothetical protein AVEN_6202-1 [Araneus ventricosus]
MRSIQSLVPVIITFHFEATRGLFSDGLRHFEPWSDEEDDTRAGTPSLNFRTTPAGGRLAPTYDLACDGPTYTTDLRGNRVSNLESSNPEDVTLPLGQRDPEVYTKKLL